jgi:hypothetical protein
MEWKVHFDPSTFQFINFQFLQFFDIQFWHKTLFFFIFYSLFWEIKEKVGGFRLKRDKIWVDTDSNPDMDRSWCQQVPFNSGSFTRVFFNLFIIWYGRYKLEIFFEFGLIIGVWTNFMVILGYI